MAQLKQNKQNQNRSLTLKKKTDKISRLVTAKLFEILVTTVSSLRGSVKRIRILNINPHSGDSYSKQEMQKLIVI